MADLFKRQVHGGNEVCKELYSIKEAMGEPKDDIEAIYQEIFLGAMYDMYLDAAKKTCKEGVLGYHRVFTNEQHTTWEYDYEPEEVLIVTIIFSCVKEGKSLAQISQELYNLGYTRMNGQALETKYILSVLRNPIYIGKTGYPNDCIMCKKKCKKKITAPNLLCEDYWNEVQKILDDKKWHI